MPSMFARHEGHSVECGTTQINAKWNKHSNLLGIIPLQRLGIYGNQLIVSLIKMPNIKPLVI